MTPWQVLLAGRVSRAALGYVHQGPGLSVKYSTARTSTAPNGSRTFCLSKEKVTLQQLNRRLALYMQQVLCLQEANQRLEHQIKEALDRKCPRELKEMDGHLRTASKLHEQISECLTAQAHMKMQLLDAELNISNLTARHKKEREKRKQLEKDLSNLRLQEEELKAHKLPELQCLLNSQTHQLLQMKHQQGVLAQVSGDTTLEMQTAASSDLVQQLDDLRQTSTNLLQRNKNKCWLDTQVFCDSSVGSEVQVQAELEELRRTSASLQDELTQLQALNILLEASSLEQREFCDLQLLVLQQRADSLCRERDSLRQAAAWHIRDYQNLLEIKSQLEKEMQDYTRLLAELSHIGYSMRHLATNGRQAPLDKTVCVHGENLRVVGHPRGLIFSVRQAPVITPFTIVQLPVTVQLPERKHSNNSFKIKSSDLIESLQMHVKQQTEALTKNTERESKTTANKEETNIQTENSKATSGGKTELKEEPNCVAQMASTDPSKESAAVPKTEMDNLILHQTDLIKDKNEDSDQIMSYSLGSTSEAVRDNREVAVTTNKASASPLCRFSDALVEISSELPIVNDKGNLNVLRLDQSSALSNMTSSKLNKILNDEDKRSGTENNVFSCPDSNGNFESKTAGTEEKVEAVVRKEKNCFYETIEVKLTPTVQYLNNLKGPEEFLGATESKNCASLTDSGVTLSSSDLDELPSPTENDVFLSPTKTCLSPEIYSGLVETEELTGLKGKVFCPIDPEDHDSRADSSKNDPEVYLTCNDTQKCLSPVMTEVSSSLKGEEERKACLIILKGKAQVRPAEKFIISKERQSLTFSGEQALTEGDRCGTVTISVKKGDSLCFGSFADNDSRSRSIGGSGFSGPVCHSIVADKKEELDLDPFYWKNSSDVRPNRDKNKNTSIVADNNNDQKETTSMRDGFARHSGSIAACNMDVPVGPAANFSGTITNSSSKVSAGSAVTAVVQGRFGHGSKEWMVYGGALGHKSSLQSGTSLTSEATKEGLTTDIHSRCLSETGRFGRRGSGEWYVYRSSLGSKKSQDGGSLLRGGKGQSLSVATNPATTNSAETGRSDKRESIELMVYGGSLEHKSSVDSGFNIVRTGNEENRATDMIPATRQEGMGRFDSRINKEGIQMISYIETCPNNKLRRYDNQGRGGWMVNSSDSFCRECKESLPTTTNMATSPPGTGRFDSRLNGEWRVYGRNTGFISNLGGSNANSEKSPSIARELPTSLKAVPRAGRFGSGGNMEWVDNRINVNANEGQKLCLSSSYTHRGPRLSSTGSGGKLSSGIVVRRSHSVGSSGSLSSSGSGGKLSTSPSSHRISSSGKSIYSSPGANRSSVGYSRPGGRTTSIQKAPRPRGRSASGGWSSSTNGGIRISGSGSKERISSPGSGRISSSSGPGRANSTGSRVINSSEWLKRTSGCGGMGNKEKISICKMAALSISAAGQERSQERRRPT
ncbi:hypothetical protein Q5P01_016792 [Channa striata]|uniref:IF rod domain-containing protein n=1 Tax=Channa striata TaxID=64152 RepID=A0AA88M8F5_CHASR|nr:hypothetical protein Q5P01_016792 [Channa striata]